MSEQQQLLGRAAVSRDVSTRAVGRPASFMGIINAYNYAVDCLLVPIRSNEIPHVRPLPLFFPGTNCLNALLSLALYGFGYVVNILVANTLGGTIDMSDSVSRCIFAYVIVMALLSWYVIIVYLWNWYLLGKVPGLHLFNKHINTERMLDGGSINNFFEQSITDRATVDIALIDKDLAAAASVQVTGRATLHVHLFNNSWHRNYYQLVFGVFGTIRPMSCVFPSWAIIFSPILFWMYVVLSSLNLAAFIYELI
eukprot:m.235368 g.235368  ORF g.235368 m.235368 type:complete len:253 (+) comp12812_c0_seq1:897-1655(+)